jgi:hypothetical protein
MGFAGFVVPRERKLNSKMTENSRNLVRRPPNRLKVVVGSSVGHGSSSLPMPAQPAWRPVSAPSPSPREALGGRGYGSYAPGMCRRRETGSPREAAFRCLAGCLALPRHGQRTLLPLEGPQRRSGTTAAPARAPISVSM